MEWRNEVLDHPHPELGCTEPSTQRGCLGRPNAFQNFSEAHTSPPSTPRLHQPDEHQTVNSPHNTSYGRESNDRQHDRGHPAASREDISRWQRTPKPSQVPKPGRSHLSITRLAACDDATRSIAAYRVLSPQLIP